MIRSHKRRALGSLLFLVSRSEAASTDCYIVWLRRDASTAFAHRGCIRSQTHRDRYSHICVNFELLLYQALLSYIFT